MPAPARELKGWGFSGPFALEAFALWDPEAAFVSGPNAELLPGCGVALSAYVVAVAVVVSLLL